MFSILLNKLFVQKTADASVQFFRYLFVGGVAAICDIGSLYVLTEYLKMFYLFSAAISFLIGLTVNYILCKIWIFTTQNFAKTKEFLFFFIISFIGLLMNESIIWLFTEFLLIWYILSKIISTMIVLFWNFFARKYLLFKNK